MNPFTLACTTCKANLLIKKASLIGQIQPCPKCGSMVEITAPKHSSAPPVVIPAAQSAAAAAVGLSDSSQLTEATEEAFAQAAALLDEEGQPTSGETAEPANATEPVPETVEASAPSPADWAADKTIVWRNYALIGGGVAVAVAMAAIIGSSLWSSPPDDVGQVPAPSEEVESQDPVSETEEPDTTVLPSEDNPEVNNTTEPEVVAPIVDPAVSTPENTVVKPEPSEPEVQPDVPSNIPDFKTETTTPDPNEVVMEKPGNPFLFNPDAVSTKIPKIDIPTKDPSGANGIATLKIEEDPLFDILGTAFPMIDNSILEEAATQQNSVPANAPLNLNPNNLAVVPDAGRAKLKKINIKTRLVDPIQAIQFNQISLIDYLRFVSQMSTVPISFDPLALKQAAVPANVPISVTHQGTTVEQMIRRAAQQHRMDIEVRDNDLRIVQPQPTGRKPRGVRLQLADLAATDEEKQTLIDLVTHLV
ncbi:MAG: hypothetical protein ACKVH8_24375, partial [Pirellulales bacterium]